MSDNYFEFSIAGAVYETKELLIADTKIYYVELCGERYTCSNTLKSKVQYRYVYANALSQQINGKHAYPHMKFSEIHNLWNLWNNDNWEDINEIINTEQVYDKAINKIELKSLKFPIIMTDRKTYHRDSRNSDEAVHMERPCGNNGYLVHLDIALWDLYLQNIDKKKEILKELKYPPINIESSEDEISIHHSEEDIDLLYDFVKANYDNINDFKKEFKFMKKELADIKDMLVKLIHYN
jgi:hypothetical protein